MPDAVKQKVQSQETEDMKLSPLQAYRQYLESRRIEILGQNISLIDQLDRGFTECQEN
jgi:hypothetical protein